MKQTVIKTEKLVKSFGDLKAVNKISLEVRQGEIFGLLGPNGAGKTTLLKILTGQLEPNSGTARVLNYDPSENSIQVKREAGIVPEIESPPSFLTGREFLEYIGLIRDLPDIKSKAGRWLDFFDMHDVSDVMGKEMSKGTRQKLMLAAAFIHEPKLLFLDEPFIGLDPFFQNKVQEYLGAHLKGGGTIFMCTHILEIAEKICHRIAIINHGRIVAEGTLSDLTRKGESLNKAFLRYIGRSK